MRLVCPACGAIASLEAWENDGSARQFAALMVLLPSRVQPWAAQYIGLFRQGDHGLAWKKAVKLLQEIKDLVQSGQVQWDGGEVRPAPPELWAEVMEYMIANGKRKLKNHNYLRTTVWERARPLAARAESDREAAARRRSHTSEAEEVTEDERERVQSMLKDFRAGKIPLGAIRNKGERE